MTVSIIDFLDDPELLGGHFAGPSWARWRACLKGGFALPMTEADRGLFDEVAGGRAPPQKPVREFVACVGRSGGKDSIAAALAVWIAVTAETSHLRPGEFAHVLCFATDKEQAGIAFSYVRAFFEDEDLPLFRGMVRQRNRRPAITDNSIELVNRAKITVATNNRRSPRGKTICAAIYDEAAFWFNESYANPDTETDTAVSPGLARFPGSLKIIISSVNKRSGLLYDRWSRFYGKDDENTLVVMGESTVFNPLLDRSVIDSELERDYERASAEYLCRWRDDLTSFLDRELVEGAVERGVRVRPAQSGIRYTAFADASSGRGDSFALAISHLTKDGRYILDCLWEKKSPFNIETAVWEASQVLREYGLTAVTGDKYAVGFVEESFRRSGIAYREADRDKSAFYLESLPLFTTGRVSLLDNPALIYQLASLERRTSTIGKDSVSHPDHKNARDDLANAACAALVLASAGSRSWDITPELLAAAKTPSRSMWGRPAELRHPLSAARFFVGNASDIYWPRGR
jgi:hypothetical protein